MPRPKCPAGDTMVKKPQVDNNQAPLSKRH